MGLDIRWPIGFMFGLIGAILFVMGLVTPVTPQSPDVNINLWWGLGLLVFGAVMTFYAYKADKKNKDQPPSPPPAA